MSDLFEPLHPYCKECRKCRLAKKDGPKSKITKAPTYKTGDFIIGCRGIPKDYNFIPNFGKIEHQLTPEEAEYSRSLYDPVLWAKIHLNWEPRVTGDGAPYQALPLWCTSKRKVLRWGRRLGKTDLLCINILHYLFTNSPTVKRFDKKQNKWVEGFSTVLVLAPYLSQIKLIFDRINKLLENNNSLSNEIKRNVANPFHVIELYNGAKVVGFPSGAKAGSGAESVRGQKADMIVLDEMDYLREEDLENILAMLMEHSDVGLIASSTPSGRREHFWRFCTERMDFKEFYNPSMANPSWSEEMEMELREFYQTEVAWQHEILAEFGEQAAGVFQVGFVDQALRDYKYEGEKYNKDWIYSIGVDWNDAINGTKLIVVGLNLTTNKFRTVDAVTVQKAGWNQTSSINELIKLNRKWKASYIYVDEGYGGTQIELLKKLGMEAELRGDLIDAQLKYVKGINLSTKIHIYDPLTQLPSKEWIKPYMVNNAVRRFEEGMIEISKYDDTLYKQLLGYIVQKVTITGMPVYVGGPDGDHDLDGLMLALLGFTLELSEFTNVKYSGQIAMASKFGERTLASETTLAVIEKREPDLYSVGSKKNKPKEPENRSDNLEPKSLTGAPTVSTIAYNNRRIYNHEDFTNDSPRGGVIPLSKDNKKKRKRDFPKRQHF